MRDFLLDGEGAFFKAGSGLDCVGDQSGGDVVRQVSKEKFWSAAFGKNFFPGFQNIALDKEKRAGRFLVGKKIFKASAKAPVDFKNGHVGSQRQKLLGHRAQSRTYFPNGIPFLNAKGGGDFFSCAFVYQKVLAEFFLHCHAPLFQKSGKRGGRIVVWNSVHSQSITRLKFLRKESLKKRLRLGLWPCKGGPKVRRKREPKMERQAKSRQKTVPSIQRASLAEKSPR